MMLPVLAQVLTLTLGLCRDGAVSSCSIPGCLSAKMVCVGGYWDECVCYDWGVTTCNDGNPCTSDTNVNNQYCSYTPSVGVSCDDGDPATGNGTCTAQGACTPGLSVQMSDSEPTTYDRLVEGVGGPVNTVVDRSAATDQGEGYGSPATAPNPLAQPVPGMPLAGAPAVIENTGEVRYSYSFDLPPARGRFQPSLSMVYSSRSTAAEGVAYGWSSPAVYIETDPGRTPQLYWDGVSLRTLERERVRMVSGPQSSRLVYVNSNVGWAPEVGGGAARMIRSDAKTWEVTDLEGTVSRFEACFDGVSKKRRCYLSSVVDPEGNRTEYSYSQQSGDVALLTQVRYNPFSAFESGWAAWADLAYVQIGGSLSAPERLLDTVSVWVVSPTTGSASQVRRYTLGHSDSAIGGKKLLSTITVSAGAGAAMKSLQPVRFTYEDVQPHATLTGAYGVRQLPTSATGDPLPPYMSGEPVYPTAAWIDLDADGYVDRVANYGGAIAWARNISVLSALPSFAPLQVLAGTDGAVLYRGENGALSTVADMNGDGLPDFVRVGLNELSVRFAEASGGGLQYVSGRFESFHGSRLVGDTEGIEDVNGDGVMDYWVSSAGILSTQLGQKIGSDPYAWRFGPSVTWPSRAGKGINASNRVGTGLPGFAAVDAPSAGTTTSCVDGPTGPYWSCSLGGAMWDPRRVQSYRDVDGDGRLDIVERGSAADGTCPSDSACAMMVWWGARSSIVRPFASEPALDGVVGGTCWSEFSFPEVHPSFAVGSCPCEYASPWPDQPDGGGVWPGESTLFAWEAGFVDLNGDQVLDYAANRRLEAGCGAPLDDTWTIFTGALSPVLLRSVTLPSGATYEVGYDVGAKFGARPRDELRWVATRLSLSGPRIASASIRYWYKDPKGGTDWFDPHRYEPRGFAESWTYDEAGKIARRTVWETRSQVVKSSPVTVELGYLASVGPYAPGSPPVFAAFKRSTMAWAQRSKDGTCSAPDAALAETSYPALAVMTSQVTSAAVATTGPLFSSSKSVDCSDLDEWGNVRRTKTDPNTSVVGDELYEHAVFDGTATCKTCPVETRVSKDPWGTDPAQQLAKSFFLYDSPPGTWDAPLPRGRAGAGRLNRIARWVASGRESVREEVAAVTAYNADGTVAFTVEDPYVGAHAKPVTTTYGYDAFGLNVVSVVRGDGTASLARDMVYDELGRLQAEYGPYVPGTVQPIPQRAYAYDVFGRPLASGRSIDAATLHVYEPLAATRYIDTVPPSVESYTFMAPRTDFEAGEAPSTADVKLVVTHFDALGRPIEVRERMGGLATALPAAQITHVLSSSWYRVTGSVKLDAAGRAVAALEPLYSTTGGAYQGFEVLSGSGTRRATVTEFDSFGRISCAKSGVWPAVNAAGCVSNLADSALHVVATQFAYSAPGDGLVHAWAIPPKSLPASTTADAYEVAYRGDGLLAWSSDAYGNRSTIEYDVLGRPLKVHRQAGAIPESRQTVWKEYDTLGRVVAEFDDNWSPGSPRGEPSHLMSYDASGRVRRVDLALIAFNLNGAVQRHRPTLNYEYRSLGRQTRVYASEPSSASRSSGIAFTTSERLAITYDQPYAGGSAYTQTAGKVASVATPLTTIAFGYDQNGATTRRDQWFTGLAGAFSVANAIANDGRLLSTTFTSPSGYAKAVTQTYRYDSAGRPVKLEAAAVSVWEAFSASPTPGGAYDALGRVPTVKSNGALVTTARTFSPYTNQLLAHVVDRSGVASYRMQSVVYAAGVLKSYQDPDTATTYQFSYDSNARAVSATASTASTTHPLRQSFAESHSFTNEAWGAGRTLGNLESVTSGGVRTKYDYRSDRVVQQRGTSFPSYVYDHAGRLRSKRTTSELEGFAYDVEDRLKQIRENGAITQVLEYGPAGELMFRKVGTKATYYVGAFATVTADVAATCAGYGCAPVAGTVRVGVHALLGGRVATVRAQPGTGADLAGDVLYYHRDVRGSVVATTLSGGVAGVSYRYAPYGKQDRTSVANAYGESELGYTGAIKLTPDGRLLHLGARVYHADLKRWLQPDTVDPLRYTYVDGDPINFSDPSGRRKISDAQRLDPEGWFGAMEAISPGQPWIPGWLSSHFRVSNEWFQRVFGNQAVGNPEIIEMAHAVFGGPEGLAAFINSIPPMEFDGAPQIPAWARRLRLLDSSLSLSPRPDMLAAVTGDFALGLSYESWQGLAKGFYYFARPLSFGYVDYALQMSDASFVVRGDPGLARYNEYLGAAIGAYVSAGLAPTAAAAMRLSVHGPSAGFATYGVGRVAGVSLGNFTLRLDVHAWRGHWHNWSWLHLNVGPSGRGEAGHLRLWPAYWPGWW